MISLTPEIKAQLAEQKKQCVFCKIISKEVQSNIIFEDSVGIAVLDIFPVRKGHVTYLPKEHYPLMMYLQPDEFRHFFSLLPPLVKAVQQGMVATAVNIFIAGGGAAGQTAPHFLIHILPRDENDGFYNFYFRRGAALGAKDKSLLLQYFPKMMAGYFQEQPAAWHQGLGEQPGFLRDAYAQTVLYEDEKVVAILPDKGIAAGHLEIYNKHPQQFQKLPPEDGLHLFGVASVAASLVFQGFGAQGTNIILKSGVTDDHKDGRTVLHILPRKQDDGLDGIWTQKQKQPEYDLKVVASKIKEETWQIKYTEEVGKKESKEAFGKEDRVSARAPTMKSSREEIAEALRNVKGL